MNLIFQKRTDFFKKVAAMNRWAVIGAVLFGIVFADFAFWQIDMLNSRTTRLIVFSFLLITYCALVAFGTTDKKRKPTLAREILLGVGFTLTTAALYHASLEGFIAAVATGVVLGLIAAVWVNV